ncbi:DUF6223 family protein [Micromonospora sp. WMMD1102]|uniref:DUF6223 family protein n=1 Tax=Micromonospora sp. WMMD1102 TaxID=3016105 RepID=UPI00241521E8|nr:DUF6223 family protein [Micromonospora sp. WMMD1102]MDG4787876.1 DUF6223 family protein [Micromonospora sp. WMMD1102]
MSVRHLLAATTTALLGGLGLGGFGLAAPAAAYASSQPFAASVYTMSAGRVSSAVAGLLGLVGVVVGVLAWARRSGRTGTGSGRRGGIVALLLGLVGMVVGGVVVLTAEGGVGTGNGLGGGFVAMALGLVSTLLGGLSLARTRRTG